MLEGIFEEPSRVTLFHIVVCLRSVQSLRINECGNNVAGNCCGLIWGSEGTEETDTNVRMRSPTPGGDINERGLQFAIRPTATSSYMLVVASFRGRAICLLPIRGHTRRASWRRHVTARHSPARRSCSVRPQQMHCSRYTSGPNLLPFKCAFTCKCVIKYSFVIRITIIITSCAPLHMISVSFVQGSAGLLYHVLFTLCSIRVTICTTCLSIKIFAWFVFDRASSV